MTRKEIYSYVGMSGPDKFSNMTSAFPIKGDMLNLLTTELKIRIKEASLSKNRICVNYTELPTFFELPS